MSTNRRKRPGSRIRAPNGIPIAYKPHFLNPADAERILCALDDCARTPHRVSYEDVLMELESILSTYIHEAREEERTWVEWQYETEAPPFRTTR